MTSTFSPAVPRLSQGSQLFLLESLAFENLETPTTPSATPSNCPRFSTTQGSQHPQKTTPPEFLRILRTLRTFSTLLYVRALRNSLNYRILIELFELKALNTLNGRFGANILMPSRTFENLDQTAIGGIATLPPLPGSQPLGGGLLAGSGVWLWSAWRAFWAFRIGGPWLGEGGVGFDATRGHW